MSITSIRRDSTASRPARAPADFFPDDGDQRAQALAGFFAGTDVDEAGEEIDEQVGIGRIAEDEATEDARDRSAAVAEPQLAADRMAGLEGLVRERRVDVGIAVLDIVHRPRREHVVALFKGNRLRRLPGWYQHRPSVMK